MITSVSIQLSFKSHHTCSWAQVLLQKSVVELLRHMTVFEKSPAQHAADLYMLEKQPQLESIFSNKHVEFIRIDGCSDEAPCHEEVQFYWTERHVLKGNSSIVVTTIRSGVSYLNRVGLLNGCLSVSHSNLFIPSSLGGPCYNAQGLDKEQPARNLDIATDVYIKKANSSPCAKQPIQLFKGADDKHAEDA